MIYDEEFRGLVQEGAKGKLRFIAGAGGEQDSASANGSSDPRLDDLIARGDESDLDPPIERGRVVILTSGTTGKPKGAPRKQPDSMQPAAALFSKIPLKARETTVIAAPMFHSWGLAHFNLALPLGSTHRAAQEVRPRGDAAGGRRTPRQHARRGARDAAADSRPGRGDDRPL